MTPSSRDGLGDSFRIIKKGDGIITAEYEAVCIAIWRKDSTVPRFLTQRQALADVIEKFPGKAGFMCVVEPSSGVPGDDVRQATSRMFEDFGAKLKACAMVVEGTGFRSAIVRSVASGIVMLNRKKTTQISYLATVSEGVHWLVQHVELSNKSNLPHVIEDVRAQLDPL